MSNKKRTAGGRTLEDYFNDYADKTPEWLIKQLFEARYRLHKEKDAIYRMSRNYYIHSAHDAEEGFIRQTNRRLADVLQRNGIRPRKLEITYRESYCRPYRDSLDDEFCQDPLCEVCDGFITGDFIETFEVYDFVISDEGRFEAFDYKLQDVEREVTKVVDAETGRVIYQRQEAEKR